MRRHLEVLGEALGGSGICFVRDVDDIIVLAPTRWRVRHVIRVLR